MITKQQGKRRNMREAAFKIVFASLFIEQTMKFRQEIYKLVQLPADCCEDADKLVDTVLNNKQELLEVLSKYCIRYKVEHLFYTDKAFLLLALAEMKYFTDVNHIIIVDEIVSIAKKYSTEHGLSFINGVLAAYIKDIELNAYITHILENTEE